MKGLYIGNLPSLSFENFKPSCFLSSSELLQKYLGHISYSKLRKSLGIPLKIEKTCESCAVLSGYHLEKVTSTFLHLWTAICVSAQPSLLSTRVMYLKNSPICWTLKPREYATTQTLFIQIEDPNFSMKEFKLINVLAEIFNRTILESLRSILFSSLSLNELLAHKSKISPFELFKNQTLPLNYFHPIGNKVSHLILPEKAFSNIKPKGSLGNLIGYNDKLCYYQILSEDSRIIETKHVDFLYFEQPKSLSSDEDLESIFDVVEIKTDSVGN
ncbi:hypothetical protein VP01_1796g8 [Puccinia sorghi]|uniref:GAG-pre-integrase domain-containing protein n=1 Tax=Puccinia sorghi TaxID=27349 RepID=A0A0L6VEZ7_9BASI|nr:hypothetical protein VP01_1796g8 [Puccinia sorghi]